MYAISPSNTHEPHVSVEFLHGIVERVGLALEVDFGFALAHHIRVLARWHRCCGHGTRVAPNEFC